MATFSDTDALRRLDADLGALTVADLSDLERVDLIRHAEDLKAKLCALQARLSADLDRSVRAAHADLGLPAGLRGRGVAGQIGLARRESPARASRLLGLANALTHELPHALAAMGAGVLSEWRATLIARETACLDPAARLQVDHLLCGRLSDGTWRFEGWGDRRLAAEAQKLVYAADPHAVVNRRAKAEADRRISLRPAPDTMSQLSGLLPLAQGVAVWATLSAAADVAKASGDPRSRGQVMADTLVARVTGQAEAAAVPIAVNLVVSDETLLGGGGQPGWLLGYGLIGPDHARDLARTAVDQALATLRRLYASPATGRLVAMDSAARDFPRGLGLFLDLRDLACRTPWCDAPIRHHDHVTTVADGGATSATNGQGLCQQCNHTKQDPGWHTHTVETVTPTGHRHRSHAPPALRPIPLRLTTGPARPRVDVVASDVRLEYAA